MTNLKNELPVAVHIASGGDARVRTGGQAMPLNNRSAGSFQVMGATRFRVKLNLRTVTGLSLLIGYSSPVDLTNASLVVPDGGECFDDVPEGTTVYFSTIGPMEETPIAGGASDYLYVSFYN